MTVRINAMSDKTISDDNRSTAASEAIEMYLATREDELSESTLNAHRYRLSHFSRWYDQQDFDGLKSLTGRNLHEYRLWRTNDGDLNVVSVATQLSTLRVFLKFCESIEVVQNGLYDKLVVPSLDDNKGVRDSKIDADHAANMLQYLSTYEYASVDHVMMVLLWRTGMRVGALQSLDVEDVDLKNDRLFVQHRPQGGTSLKLGKNGERIVALTESTVRVIEDYLQKTRSASVDENGREPLITFGRKRPAKSTIREHVHRNTQPCLWQRECPHDRTMDSCEDIGLGQPHAGCPSS